MSIIVLKGLLDAHDAQSLFADIEGFARIGFGSQILRYELEPDEILEAALFGHTNLALDQGPLTVAALGWNPPERSLQFHISMMSVHDDEIEFVRKAPTAEEQKAIVSQLERLNTTSLTTLVGEGLDHAMVWEKRLDIRTQRPSEAIALGLRQALPEGDGENDLRRFIDDSVNLLSPLEFNQRRVDHGILPINLAWPWGQGESHTIPNRALELGVPWRVRAHSLATRGLARLSGFMPEKVALFGDLDFRELLPLFESGSHDLTILDLGAFPVGDEAAETRVAKLTDFGQVVLEPLLEWQHETKSSLAFVGTGHERQGLVALMTKPNERDTFPFDERSLTERKVARMSLLKLLDVVG